jgi:hypothetical protein
MLRESLESKRRKTRLEPMMPVESGNEDGLGKSPT